ncbi:MAG TPA: hypothetical protein VK465_08675 [Fibrobacteria bacterium]|nr:hypothetical protein [Fibrobacteria bacterium]
MARTYWAPRGQDWEFLGTFPEGHKATPRTPQATAAVIDITDLVVREVMDRMRVTERESPPRLVGLPSAIARRLHAGVVLPWAQIEGYVK